MPMGGKSRGSKRQSSVSYASTVTTVVFVTLCILGVWMLTSNSVSSPRTTITTDTTGDNAFAGLNEVQQQQQLPTKINEEQKDKAVFEDNPGQLPDEAVKPDEDKAGGESFDQDKGKGGGGRGMVIEENQHGLQGKESAEEQVKPKPSDTQISEESVMTQNQHSLQTIPIEVEIKQTIHDDPNKVNQNENINNNQDSLDNQDRTRTVEQQQMNEKPKEQRRGRKNQHKPKGDDPEQQQNQEQPDSHMQGVATKATFSDETKDKQKEILHATTQNEAIQIVLSTSTNPETVEKEPQSDTQNQETQQQQQQQQLQQQQQQHQELQQQQQQHQELQQQQQQEQEQQQQQQQEQEQQQQEQQQQEQKQQQQQQQQQQEEEQQQQQQQQQEHQQQEQQQQQQQQNESNTDESLGGSIPKESTESKKAWKSQQTQSENEKERRRDESSVRENIYGYTWQLCNVTAGPDYIPCLDNEKALKKLRSTKHFEHRERHCPEEGPTCLVPTPVGYRRLIPWPQSRDKIWYHNVPHTKLARVKGHQNWVKVSGETLTFPGGGTQFIHGALHYINFLQLAVPAIKWGKRTRVALDVGCGVASFGGFLFDRDVLTMSFAPKDEHEAQVQFALERGIPAISAVMGSQRLPFPCRVFDVVHCARCRVPWHADGGMLLLELNRVLRPDGYFIWSATPVYQKLKADVEIWNAMSALTKSMCWELVTIKKDKLNAVGVAIYRKPSNNECYEKRIDNNPPMCMENDDANAIWHVPLRACMHRVPTNPAERGAKWPAYWPSRLQKPPYWLNRSQMGIYGKPAPQDFARDYDHWTRVVSKLYMSGLGISWKNVRNVMDMRAVYGGFAAALKDIKVWVMNVVNFDSPDTLPIIYERGLFGIYHDWCESFSTYPRTYDLLHADHLFSKLKKRCKLEPVLAEVDRIVRPGGKLIVRDESNVIGEIENLLKSLHWEVHLTFSKDQEGILSAQKGDWRPTTYQAAI